MTRLSIILFVFAGLSGGSQAENSQDSGPRLVPLGGKSVLTMEGDIQSSTNGTRILSGGSWINVSSIPERIDESLLALEDGVTVRCSKDGILSASGVFILEIRTYGGTRYRVPKLVPSLSRRFDPKMWVPIQYSKVETEIPGVENWVAWNHDKFFTKGYGSVEAIHPPSDGHPICLVSVGGETPQVRLVSDLRNRVEMDGRFFEFWKSAYAGLDREKEIYRHLRVRRDRVGAEAYLAHIRETLEGIEKIRQGYRLLQNNRFSGEVIRRLLDRGIPLPRLTLAEITVIRGRSAFSIRPFLNWKGEGRVLADRADLVTGVSPGPLYPDYRFEVSELTGKIYRETRLFVRGDEARIETRRPGETEWTIRPTHQFDLHSVLHLSATGEAFLIAEKTDATGYFRRKGFDLPGEIETLQLRLTPESLHLRYGPRSRNTEAAIRLSRFLGLHRNLFFPDRKSRFSGLRPVLRTIREEEIGFIRNLLDHLVATAHEARIDRIDDLEIDVRTDKRGMRTVKGAVGDLEGNRSQFEYRVEKPIRDSLVERVYAGLSRSRYATDWLDLDFGFTRY